MYTVTETSTSTGIVLIKILSFLLNFVIAGAWIWVFQAIGWIHFTNELPLWQNIAIVAFLGWVVMLAGSLLYTFFLVATCGLGCLLLPVYFLAIGFFALWGVSTLTNIFVFDPSLTFFQYLAMSIAFGLLRIPDYQLKKETTYSYGNSSSSLQ